MHRSEEKGTATELARRLGVTAKRITTAIERGEIKAERLGTTERGRRRILDMDGAASDFRSSRERLAASVKLPKLPAGLDPAQLDDGDGLMPPEGVDLRLAQTIREWWTAVRARARHEREAGKWVKAEQVRRETFAVTRATRDAFLALPDRVSDDLAAESSPASVRERLHAEITQVLAELASRVEKVCAEAV
jgi:hypothetical protein